MEGRSYWKRGKRGEGKGGGVKQVREKDFFSFQICIDREKV